MSKMGICTIASYRNSGLFDIVGLSDEIVNDCFTGAHSDLAGLTYADIEERINKAHHNAFKEENTIFLLI